MKVDWIGGILALPMQDSAPENDSEPSLLSEQSGLGNMKQGTDALHSVLAKSLMAWSKSSIQKLRTVPKVVCFCYPSLHSQWLMLLDGDRPTIVRDADAPSLARWMRLASS